MPEREGSVLCVLVPWKVYSIQCPSRIVDRHANASSYLEVLAEDAAGGIDDEEDVPGTTIHELVVEVLANVVGILKRIVVLI